MTYSEIIDHGILIDERMDGRFERYNIGDNTAVWVDHQYKIVSDPEYIIDEMDGNVRPIKGKKAKG